MLQFTVPQFIDVEDKIIGPITTRQFVIMLSSFMLIALCYRLFAFNFFVFIGITIFGVSGIFAFFKINGMPFHFFVLNFVQTLRRPSLRVWNNKLMPELHIEEEADKIEQKPILKPKSINTSRLAELSLIVDTQGVYRGEDGAETNIRQAKDPAEKLLKDFVV